MERIGEVLKFDPSFGKDEIEDNTGRMLFCTPCPPKVDKTVSSSGKEAAPAPQSPVAKWKAKEKDSSWKANSIFKDVTSLVRKNVRSRRKEAVEERGTFGQPSHSAYTTKFELESVSSSS